METLAKSGRNRVFLADREKTKKGAPIDRNLYLEAFYPTVFRLGPRVRQPLGIDS